MCQKEKLTFCVNILVNMKEKWNRFLEQVHRGNTIRVPIFTNIVQKRDWIMLVLQGRQAPFWTSEESNKTSKGTESGCSS